MDSAAKIIKDFQKPRVKGKIISVSNANRKGNLLDSLIGTTPGFNQKDSLYFKGKDTKLLSILQIVDVKREETGRHPSNRSV